MNITRALCSALGLLIADEILSGLDVSVQAQLPELLLRLRQAAGAVGHPGLARSIHHTLSL